MKKLVTGALALLLCTLLAACSSAPGGSSANNGYITSQEQFIHTTSYGSYACFVNLAYDGDVIDYSNEADAKKVLYYKENGEYVAEARLFGLGQDGNSFYGMVGNDRDAVYRYTVVDEHTANREIWLSAEQLSNSCLAVDTSIGYATTLSNFLADGDAVYALVKPSPEYWLAHLEVSERIVCISKDGTDIHFVGDEDVRATEFVVRDGWIYYADNGYVPGNGRIDYDESRIGLYRIKTDGTEKELLLSGGDASEENHFGRAARLSLYGDSLYFLNLWDTANSRLYRMGLNGGHPEMLLLGGIRNYTIDPSTNTVYYQPGDYATETSVYDVEDPMELCCADLDSQEVRTIWTTRQRTGYMLLMAVHEGYLYYYNYESSGGAGRMVLCHRINISTGEAQSLETRQEDAGFTTDDDGNTTYNAGTITIGWYPISFD